MKAWAANFVGMNIADAVLTLMLLDRGFTEANPLWVAVATVSPTLFVGMKTLLALAIAGLLLYFKWGRVLVACSATMWLVVLWNAGLLLFG